MNLAFRETGYLKSAEAAVVKTSRNGGVDGVTTQGCLGGHSNQLDCLT